MRVAAVQFEPTRGPSPGSLPRLVPLVQQAARGADLVVCPEMAATDYLFPDPSAARRVAEMPMGPTFQALAPIARRNGCWLVCGFAEDAGDVLFNSALVIDPDGQLAFVYRKLLLYEPDHCWASPGDRGVVVIDIAGLRATVGICMDLNNPHYTRMLMYICYGNIESSFLCIERNHSFERRPLYDGVSASQSLPFQR